MRFRISNALKVIDKCFRNVVSCVLLYFKKSKQKSLGNINAYESYSPDINK